MSSKMSSPKQLIFSISPGRTSISMNPTLDLREEVRMRMAKMRI